MPEGHTIHRAAKDQRPLVVGKTLQVTAPDGRYVDEAKHLDKRTITEIEPIGKHLFYRFDAKPPNVLHVHLALFGKFRTFDGDPPEPKGAVRYRLAADDATLDLHGCRTADLIDDEEVEAIRDRLGPDPLDPKADVERVRRRIGKSSAPIAGLLMDQSVVSGLGNIFRAEILYRQRVPTRAAGKELTDDQFNRIWVDAVALLKVGVKQGRIITIPKSFAKERHGKTFSKLRNRERFLIYKQPTCPFTGAAVETYELAGRTVYHVPSWQTGVSEGVITT